MYLHPQGFHIIGSVRSPGEVGQVELDLVPSFVQPHGHGADERFDSGSWLVIAGAEASPHIFIIKYLGKKQNIESAYTTRGFALINLQDEVGRSKIIRWDGVEVNTTALGPVSTSI